MPIQKEKKRRKPRSRGNGVSTALGEIPETQQAKPVKKSRPRFEAPMWLNLALGIGMVVFGVVFFVISIAGGSAISTQNIIILVLYLFVAALYLGKAWRQRTAA